MTHPVIIAARQALGTPFLHQGRQVGRGMDCAGLYVYICQQLGLPHRDAVGYPRSPYDGELERQLDAQPCLRRIALADAGPGDLLVIRYGRAPQHIAIRSYLGCVIHASSDHGGVVEHLDTGLRVVRAYRLEVDQ